MRKLLIILSLLAGVVVIAMGQPRVAQALTGESWIAYRLVHPLHVIDAKSTSPEYRVELDPMTKEIKSVAAEVDVMSFNSGNSNRDSHAMEVVDALTYPEVSFASTSVIQKDDSLFVTGKLTFHGVTKEITMAGTATWQPNRLDVHGAFDIGLTEFKIDRPSLLMIPVEDKLNFTLAAAFSWK
jgi:polyisoprenoid-binding protein YceI